jgi:FtsZ-binding cell division protein ZapB
MKTEFTVDIPRLYTESEYEELLEENATLSREYEVLLEHSLNLEKTAQRLEQVNKMLTEALSTHMDYMS